MIVPALAWLLILAVLAWLAVNLYKSPAQFINVFFIGLTNGSVYALIALGYTLVYGILELINFAHGDVFMIGGMTSATLATSSRMNETPIAVISGASRGAPRNGR